MQLWSLPGQRLLSSADNTLKKNWLLELKCPCLMISESPSNKFYLAYFYLSDPNNLSHFTMRFEQNTNKKYRSTANFFNCIQNCADHFIFLDSNTHFQYVFHFREAERIVSWYLRGHPNDDAHRFTPSGDIYRPVHGLLS